MSQNPNLAPGTDEDDLDPEEPDYDRELRALEDRARERHQERQIDRMIEVTRAHYNQ